MESIFSVTTGFYLTGGTCLNRFYLERRYSDDLDLFTSDNNLFREDSRLLRETLSKAVVGFDTVVDTRDFIRLMVDGVLKVDLVNDRVYRVGKSAQMGTILVDNISNIGANKICAVLGRDDPKDIFDLYTIFSLPEVSWPDIMAAAARKCVFDREELRFRLKSFPMPMIGMLPLADPVFAEEFQRDYPTMLSCLLAAV